MTYGLVSDSLVQFSNRNYWRYYSTVHVQFLNFRWKSRAILLFEPVWFLHKLFMRESLFKVRIWHTAKQWSISLVNLPREFPSNNRFFISLRLGKLLGGVLEGVLDVGGTTEGVKGWYCGRYMVYWICLRHQYEAANAENAKDRVAETVRAWSHHNVCDYSTVAGTLDMLDTGKVQ